MTPTNNNTLQPSTATDTDQQPPPGDLGPELVRQVADRVWAMLQRDLQLDRERQRLLTQGESYG